ncbi:arylsulfatase [Draconibacterium orientale]|uniref:arylsulfatase n=1 Tax=Draconibacterium orientale TaxID=1168034 RepID=UPI002ABDCCBB|nr:arylsulfatase [Draconibacterium orientale]
MVQKLLFVFSFILGFSFLNSKVASAQNNTPVNVIYIMADDLGIGDVGVYGQDVIKTPAIDALAKNGMVFTQHYSGSTVCAPSRCTIMTGKHTGHSFVRGNKGVTASDGVKYDYPMAGNEITVAELMKQKNYQTACVGKWGLGGPNSEGHPNKQGFDYFFGYLGQGNAHRYYPEFLYENEEKIKLKKEVYSHSLIMDKALEFIDRSADKPFFLYLTPTIPHADIDIPEELIGDYDGKFHEIPHPDGQHYIAQQKPKAVYAAMVSLLDKDVQRIMDLLDEKGVLENTMVIFTSDNGNHKEGGHLPNHFDSNGPFRGWKRDLYDGGIRAPFIVHWPAKVKAGSVSYHVSAFWDFLPTMCDLIDVKVPESVDGISYLPAITGETKQKEHDYLYWEFHEQGGKQAVLKDNWKLIRLNVNKPEQESYELYNLTHDPGECFNVLDQYPEKVSDLKETLFNSHETSEIYKFKTEK